MSLKTKPCPGIKLAFENRFGRLLPNFYTRMNAERFSAAPYLIHANPEAAELIDLDPAFFKHRDFPAWFSGNINLPGSDPLAMVYAGHQFGHYVPQLGDGRALLLGQVRNKKGELWDIQLKGSGLTPYSRFADGRAVLRSCIREYLCGDALDALGIPTTRALCIVGTGEQVRRERFEPGAILTRLSRSHIRFGHFEYFYYTGQHEALTQLADYVISEHFTEQTHQPDRYALMYREAVTRTAKLIAQWQANGFAHGVMNTDNMSITGLTIDYGPFGFMEAFDPGFICNHSDHAGRYAFDQQPAVAQWNLYALAHALQPLVPLEETGMILAEFAPVFNETYDNLMIGKLGLTKADREGRQLWQELLRLMQAHRTDYILTFRNLSDLTSKEGEDAWLVPFGHDDAAKAWLARWQARASQKGSAEDRRRRMKAVNPKYVLRNWVAETAIRAAEDEQDYTVIDQFLKLVQRPYEEHPAWAHFAVPPPPEMAELCVSCSS